MTAKPPKDFKDNPPIGINLQACKSPLDAIEENKHFVRELKRQGMKQGAIKKILLDTWKETWEVAPDLDLDDPATQKAIQEITEKEKKYIRSIKKISACLNEEMISEDAKKILKKERERLCQLKRENRIFVGLEDLFRGTVIFKNESLPLKGGEVRTSKRFSGPRDPKTKIQMLGFKVKALYDYISNFSRELDSSDSFIYEKDQSKKSNIFRLIAELLSVISPISFPLAEKPFNWQRVKTLYFNSLRTK